MSLSRERASMLGKLGSRRRWAKYPNPETRRAQTQAARDAQRQRYIERAYALMGELKTVASPAQIEECATQMRLGDLAAMRLKSWTVRMDRKGAARKAAK